MVTVIAAGDAGLHAAGPAGSCAAVPAAVRAAVFLIRRRTGRRA